MVRVVKGGGVKVVVFVIVLVEMSVSVFVIVFVTVIGAIVFTEKIVFVVVT